MDREARRDVLRVAFAAGAFVVLALLVAPQRDAAPWETDVVDWATKVPDVLGVPARGVMQLGAKAAVPLVAIGLWLVTRRWTAAVAVLAAALIESPTNRWFKDIIDRPRPSGVRTREHVGDHGFPSGHTATAFALAAVATAYLPKRWRWLPFTLAAIVGLARMHVGVHYPSDVLGGALWGLTVGWTVVLVAHVGPRLKLTRRSSVPSTETDERRNEL
jgi:membrane-associated phospholipid phosphatase